MEYELNALGQKVGRRIPSWTAPIFPAPEPFEGHRCRLEPLSVVAHASQLYEALAEEASGAMWTYLPYGPFASVEEYREWVTQVAAQSDPQLYAIQDRSTGRALGVAGYLRIDPKNGSIEVGHLAYSPRLQRSPLATEAMYLFMARAFALGYRRYEWKCHSMNEPSRAAALRLGFQFEGIFRQAVVVKGRTRDTAWFSIVDREWPALRAAYERWLRPENFDESGRQRERLSDLTAAALRSVRGSSNP